MQLFFCWRAVTLMLVTALLILSGTACADSEQGSTPSPSGLAVLPTVIPTVTPEPELAVVPAPPALLCRHPCPPLSRLHLTLPSCQRLHQRSRLDLPRLLSRRQLTPRDRHPCPPQPSHLRLPFCQRLHQRSRLDLPRLSSRRQLIPFYRHPCPPQPSHLRLPSCQRLHQRSHLNLPRLSSRRQLIPLCRHQRPHQSRPTRQRFRPWWTTFRPESYRL